MKKTIFFTKALLACLSALSIHSDGKAQMLTLEECIGIYTNDTSYIKGLHIQGFDADTTVIMGSGYAKTLKSKTNNITSLLKVVDPEIVGNLLNYAFESIEQYTSLQKSLRSGAFTFVDSVPQMFALNSYSYTTEKLSITLMKTGSDVFNANSGIKYKTQQLFYMLMIQDRKKKDMKF